MKTGKALILKAVFLMLLMILPVSSGAGIFRVMAADESTEDNIGVRDVWQKKTEGKGQQKGGTGQTESQTEVQTEAQSEARTEWQSGGNRTEETKKQYNTTVQTTEDDIMRMNKGNATILYSDEGYLTFLRGKYWDEKILNEEDGIRSLWSMASLLGLSRGSEFFAVFAQTNRFGYTTYIYQQRYGDLTLDNAVLKIIVDPEGYTAGLVSSFVPNAGIAPSSDDGITAQEAESIVRDVWQGEELHIFEEHTRQTSITINSTAYHCWAVFTDMPKSMSQEQESPYLEHLIGFEGSYLLTIPVESPEDFLPGDTAAQEDALSWFKGKTADTYTGQVTLHDGTTKTITVPVVKDEQGRWYLADAQRHILLADCYDFLYANQLSPHSSKLNGSWNEHYLIVYDSLIKVYDFFAQYGYVSVDGFGVPILLLTDYCDESGRSVDNACFMGFSRGWAKFGFSESNDFGEAIDVVGHEFTHGITRYAVAGRMWANEGGAMNEGLSDIIGNLCEIIMGETDDQTWAIGENCGTVVRVLSFPWIGRQPVCIGGTYYVEPNDPPNAKRDSGGIHTNCSLITYPAWLLYAQGMDPEEEMLLWLEAINLLTPEAGFLEMRAAMEFAAEIRGLDAQWIGKIHMVFEQAGIMLQGD